jgi:hypothetical protein
MTRYMVQGSNIFIGNELDMVIFEELPLGTYSINLSQERGFFLTVAPDFTLPKKLYGKTFSRANRFLDTFESRPATTGVLLEGVKGSGKSLEMKTTAVEAKKRGFSTIIVPAAYYGSAFNKFIQAINEPCIIILDEFEKMYSNDEQEQLLTLLDGTFSTKKMFILTCNDRFKVNSHMHNRPGRLFYNVQYKGLDTEFVQEYCEDNLNDKDKIESVVTVAGLINDFNFDMLQALVEELNRYPAETVKQAVDILNINFSYDDRTQYSVSKVEVEDKVVPNNRVYPDIVAAPLKQEYLNFWFYKGDPDAEGTPEEESIVFEPSDKATFKVRPDLKEIVLINSERKLKVTMTKKVPVSFSYDNLY